MPLQSNNEYSPYRSEVNGWSVLGSASWCMPGADAMELLSQQSLLQHKKTPHRVKTGRGTKTVWHSLLSTGHWKTSQVQQTSNEMLAV